MPLTAYDTLHYTLRPDGTLVGWGIGSDGGTGMSLGVFAKWPGTEDLVLVAEIDLWGDDFTMAKDILTTLGIYGSVYKYGLTWQQIEDGAAFIDTNGQSYSGTVGVSQLFDDYCASDNCFGILTSTDKWMQLSCVAKVQARLDATINATVAPPPPVLPTYPPGATDIITSATGVVIAQQSRMTGTIDPANPLRIVVGTTPIQHN